MRAAPVALLTAAILVATPTIASAGSDSPTPYTVTASGVSLPAGQVFREHGHVNYRATALDGTGEQSFNVHLETANGRSTAAYVGASFLDFAGAVAAFPAGFCVTWVQVEGFDEHFGEGGQAPECTPEPTPLSPAPPVTRPAPSPVPSSEVPDGGTPVEAPTSPPVAETPTTAPPVTERELAATGPAPEDVPVAGATPVAQADPSAAPGAATPGAAAPGAATAADDEGLAATGSNALLVTAGAVVLLAAGIVAVLLSRRSRRA
ncbi:hypothetical protein [Oerskovia rustica]|uniref:Gram-positive cocci surface proteins LPxTG domain-containing protein n=1 Tax=Oerskovia rustica TaxID=2762237 RepID=A0ABR8RXA7_9CELL|nr:hypothetical protein [Oerskovia rustica]MBD7952425.1 hypothetical protein [Oerskovia rustica]